MMVLLANLVLISAQSSAFNLLVNPGFESGNDKPNAYELQGGAKWVQAGYLDEVTTPGVSLDAIQPSGSVSQMVKGLKQDQGRWLRFQFRGRAEDGFILTDERLYIKFEFFVKDGTVGMDSAERLIYREVLRDRKDFTQNGNKGATGAAVWRSYEFEELLPFSEVDSMRITVGFSGGGAKDKTYTNFFVDDWQLTQSNRSSRGLTEPTAKGKQTQSAVDPEQCIALGGRWYYEPLPSESKLQTADHKLAAKLKVTEANANRLYYKVESLQTPFAGNMTSVLQPGFLDTQGKLVTKATQVPDNVVIEFEPGSKEMVVHARNVPNHPVAKFPDTYGSQGYNPSYVQAHDYTYHLPLEPQKAANPVAMTPNNSNRGLNMGSIGFAVNGVVFYNPFDAGMQDASSIMDRCCGHPSPDNRYHYHKYPICVNTPFVDKGEAHSPIIGFAFDGFPVYGPYESNGVMAKDSQENPLNEFNGHQDAIRGWHYHVTPGKFPYIIGGYWGTLDRRNLDRGPGF